MGEGASSGRTVGSRLYFELRSGLIRGVCGAYVKFQAASLRQKKKDSNVVRGFILDINLMAGTDYARGNQRPGEDSGS